MDWHIRGHHPVGESDRPRNRGGPAVGAVTGEQGAESTDAVGNGERNSGGAGDHAERELVPAHDHQSGNDPANEAAVPGESHLTEVVHREVGQLFQEVVDLGPGEAPDSRPDDEGVGRVPLQALLFDDAGEQEGCHESRQGLAHPVGLDVEAKD